MGFAAPTGAQSVVKPLLCTRSPGCVTVEPVPGLQAAPGALFLMNRTRQKSSATTSKIRIQKKTSGSALGASCLLPCLFQGKPVARLWPGEDHATEN